MSVRRIRRARSAAHAMRRRLGIVAGALLVAYAGLVARAVQLQAVDGEWLAARAEAQHRTILRVGGLRGEILDRHGELLAISADAESVAASPRRIADPVKTSARVAGALGLRPREVQRRIERGRSFVWLKRWVSPDEAERVRGLGLEGIELVHERRRLYPHAELAAAYLGFAGRDEVGLAGVELAFDGVLRGEASDLPALRDARGRKLLPNAAADARSRDGARLVLALDAQLQYAAERALDRSIESTKALHGSIVAIDPRNGDVLAAAERPGFDPNRFWLERPPRFRARAFTDAFEPGSTLKPFVLAAARQHRLVELDQRIDCEGGRWQVADRVIHDWRPHGVLTVRDVLVQSSNIGAAKVAERLGSARLVDGLRGFGFGVVPGSRFPGEAPGVVHPISSRQVVERATLAFGQGMTATALQLAVAGAALANGGERVRPRMALRVDRPEGSYAYPSGASGRAVDERTTRELMDLLREVVVRGTGRGAQPAGVPVAGKTGTAQKVLNGRYAEHRFVASFLGFLPASDPRVVVVVVLDEPRRPHTGGGAAAPVFRDVASNAARHLLFVHGDAG